MTVRRRCTGGGASTRNGDGTGTIEGRRRRLGGVGCYIGVRAALFIGAGGEARGQGFMADINASA
jgi:hypothetical protein